MRFYIRLAIMPPVLRRKYGRKDRPAPAHQANSFLYWMKGDRSARRL